MMILLKKVEETCNRSVEIINPELSITVIQFY